MAPKCPRCGRFKSASSPCANCASNATVPVVFQNSSASGSSTPLSRASPSTSLNFLPISSFSVPTSNAFSELQHHTSIREPDSTAMSSQDREKLTFIKDQAKSLQIQISDLKTKTQALEIVKEDLIVLQNKLEKEMEQNMQEVMKYLKEAVSQENTERQNAMMTIETKLSEIRESLQEKLSDAERARQDICDTYSLKLNEFYLSLSTDLERDKNDMTGRWENFKEQLLQGEQARIQIMISCSELKGRIISLEGQQHNREIIIIILVLIICWVLYSSFVTKF